MVVKYMSVIILFTYVLQVLILKWFVLILESVSGSPFLKLGDPDTLSWSDDTLCKL